ncbi:hypothetical protein IFM58399_08293 [Aspergillus lentulus]|uniref:Uncharacterized protein n=1 Tax=Aspergillus lentulus TaxID=293939 RepID=A0AAN5YVG4_ASPLE|nr:uncharacterized protein IFM58399_08293 [Aspergillus lentulus]KAF4160413.1 hypothetical protein CNMCM6069_008763 [Aspergillus lentulus]KAF4169703.1 hypothetical protein CNMCM6936_006862 [Aspergillus lentulus]KAF4181070.1 hypothetical protein CNMCM8060_009716 [Aspergillus lentulus]KAF4187734.1 hypothetical protein CNMCM7927_003680 [Aspergillus lentulus]KAF4196011.1 hypothetical protein CNMCM8694_005605 [Aspergillus lentulus]
MGLISSDSLLNKKYNEQDCLLAVRGQRIPKALGEEITQLCVVRGIRYHPGFATELRGLCPKFTRALNARDIMSDKIPDMSDPDEFPYCIWYPETAKEETYRDLARRYPQMKYLVGRACAVAGYVNLFKELDLLPEVHIAEEARENKQWVIYEVIMAADRRYNAMDDYTRAVFPKPVPGYLNADTAVRSYLDIKTKFEKPPGCDEDWSIFDVLSIRDRGIFDITEDDRIDEFTSEPLPPQNDDVSHLLYTPLPADLPTMNKDLLILMAAYYGNIERYARLRRPNSWVTTEVECVVRGVYHNSMFAKWWSLQPGPGPAPDRIEKAINARFIMNNDLSRITPETRHLPYCIWYPSFPHVATCKELLRRVPSMKPAVARVCILRDYSDYWDELDADPDVNLMAEARESPNPKYLRDLEARIPERGCRDFEHDSTYSTVTRDFMYEPTSTLVLNRVPNEPYADIEMGVPYNGRGANMAYIELCVSVPDEVKKVALEELEETRSFDVIEYYNSLGENRHSTRSTES